MKKPWKVLVKIRSTRYPGYSYNQNYEAFTEKGAEKWAKAKLVEGTEYRIVYKP